MTFLSPILFGFIWVPPSGGVRTHTVGWDNPTITKKPELSASSQIFQSQELLDFSKGTLFNQPLYLLLLVDLTMSVSKAVSKALMLLLCTAALLVQETHALECPNVRLSSSVDTYTIGVLAWRGKETAYNEFQPTAEYLTQTVGATFDPPVRFQAIPVGFDGDILDELESGRYDFVYVNPTMFSCISSEIGAHSLATRIAKRKVGGKVYELTKFGSVIFTRADNAEIDALEDIKDKKVGVVSLAGLGRYVES